MMTSFHIAFSLILMTFLAGCALIAWSRREIASKTLLRVAGYIAILLSLANVLCLGYLSARHFNGECSKYHHGSYSMGMMDEQGMLECPSMKNMMKEKTTDDKSHY